MARSHGTGLGAMVHQEGDPALTSKDGFKIRGVSKGSGKASDGFFVSFSAAQERRRRLFGAKRCRCTDGRGSAN